MIRVVLADDHELVRAGLRMLVDAQSDMEVIAEAATGEEAVALIRSNRPHVAVLDLTMPGAGGLGAARDLARELGRDGSDGSGRTRVVILTRHNDEAYVRELLAAGALGYVLKHSASTELLQAIRAAAKGERYLDPALEYRELPDPTMPKPRRTITDREREILRLTAVGHGNKDIATRLGISIKTVEVHKANAMRKLDLAGRADVVRYAVVQGWMKDP